MPQDPVHGRDVRDQRQEPQSPAAARASEDVHAKGPRHQLRSEGGARPARARVTVHDLDVTIHFVKENAVVSKDSRSYDKFLHGIKVLMAKNDVDSLSEEVKKGLLEKAEQGH